MEFAYETLGTNTYLSVALQENDMLDTMSLGMLTNNAIPGIAGTTFTQMDNEKYIKFNISAKVPAAQVFSGTVNKKRLVGVFTGIIESMLSAEDYMLDPDSLILDMEYIYTDVTTCETALICLPVVNYEHKNEELSAFFKNIIFNTQFDQTENCDHVAQILNYLNSNRVLVLADFKKLLEEISKQKSQKAQQTSQPVIPQRKPQEQPIRNEPAQMGSQQTPQRGAPQSKPAQPAQPAQYVQPERTAQPAQYVRPVQTVQNQQTQSVLSCCAAKEEDTIGLMYLLQHYNKENAAKYKEQQEKKKSKNIKNGNDEASKKTAVKNKPGKADKKQKKSANVGFAVPGQKPADMGFEIPGQAATPVQKEKPVMAEPQFGYIQPQQPVQKKEMYTQPAQQTAQTGSKISFGETTVLGGGVPGETTVLMAAKMPAKDEPHLIRQKNNEKIPLTKPVFRIGKERSYVDYFVSDNTAVSRSHANIVNRNGEFFVVDTNSTNHTYVNGAIIQSNQEVALAHGTKIRLANEEFEFKMR